MIKIKMINLLNSSSTLQKIGQQQLHGIEAYKISKILSIIDKELKLYDQAHNKLLQEYCIKDEQGKIYIDEKGQATIQPNNIDQYNKETNKMLQVQIELNIPFLEINELQNFILTPEDISKIKWWIKEE